MRKTSAELSKYLLDFFGLKVGDRVKLVYHDNKIYKVVVNDNLEAELVNINDDDEDDRLTIWWLRDEEYEIIAGPKRIGDRRCDEDTTRYDCKKCPLYGLDCAEGHHEPDGGEEETIYYTLDCWAEHYGYSKDHPIYLAFKAELDKEEE